MIEVGYGFICFLLAKYQFAGNGLFRINHLVAVITPAQLCKGKLCFAVCNYAAEN